MQKSNTRFRQRWLTACCDYIQTVQNSKAVVMWHNQWCYSSQCCCLSHNRVCMIQNWPLVYWQPVQVQAEPKQCVLDAELQDRYWQMSHNGAFSSERSQVLWTILTHSSSSNGSADGHNSLLLANDPGVQSLLHLDQLLTLVTADLLNGDTCSR